MVLLKQVFLRRKTHKGRTIKFYTIFNFCPDYNAWAQRNTVVSCFYEFFRRVKKHVSVLAFILFFTTL